MNGSFRNELCEGRVVFAKAISLRKEVLFSHENLETGLFMDLKEQFL